MTGNFRKRNYRLSETPQIISWRWTLLEWIWKIFKISSCCLLLSALKLNTVAVKINCHSSNISTWTKSSFFSHCSKQVIFSFVILLKEICFIQFHRYYPNLGPSFLICEWTSSSPHWTPYPHSYPKSSPTLLWAVVKSTGCLGSKPGSS